MQQQSCNNLYVKVIKTLLYFAIVLTILVDQGSEFLIFNSKLSSQLNNLYKLLFGINKWDKQTFAIDFN